MGKVDLSRTGSSCPDLQLKSSPRWDLQVMESVVKNCGQTVHDEVANKQTMEELKDLLKVGALQGAERPVWGEHHPRGFLGLCWHLCQKQCRGLEGKCL